MCVYIYIYIYIYIAFPQAPDAGLEEAKGLPRNGVRLCCDLNCSLVGTSRNWFDCVLHSIVVNCDLNCSLVL